MDSANECFSGCAREHKAANMNGRVIPGAEMSTFRLTNAIPERIIFVSRGIIVLFSFSSLTFFGVSFKFFAREDSSSGSTSSHCPLPVSINFNFHTGVRLHMKRSSLRRIKILFFL